MSKLSKASEKRLMIALEKAASLISTGLHPNEAIIKAAGDEKVPSGHIKLMVNAINTGTTNAHRTSKKDPLEKAADFPLADVPAILNVLYPDKVKSAAIEIRETTISDEYKIPPRWVKAAQTSIKPTIQVPALTEKKYEPARDEFTATKKAQAALDRLRITHDAAREELSSVVDASIKAAHDLEEYFLTPGAFNYDEVKENSVLMFGKAAEAVFSHIEKRGSAKRNMHPVDTNKAPYSYVQRLIKISGDFHEKAAAYGAAQKSLIDETRKFYDPFVLSPSLGHSVLTGLSSLMQKSAEPAKTWLGDVVRGGFGMMAGGDTAKGIAKNIPGTRPPSEKEELDDLRSVLDPSHESEIRNIQSEALLNDLMANDEVVSGYDPEEVLDAFNEISQMTPYAANKKVIMRDLLRKRLAGGGQALDQFTIGDTLKSQQTLKDLNTVPEVNISVLRSLGILPNVLPKPPTGPR